MSDANRPLMPKTTLAVIATSSASDEQRQVLDALYQPILGVTAYAVVNALWQQVMMTPNLHVERVHSDLLARLNIGIGTFAEARYRLEAVGLLKTYENQPNLMPELIYELHVPVTPNVFFEDDLLSLLLLEVVGERQFSELRGQFLPQVPERKNWHDISASFLDVFQLNNRLIASPPKVISQTKSQFKQVNEDQDQAPLLGQVKTDFDFELLASVLQRSYIDLTDLQQYRDLIVNEHLLYGIDEMDMARLLGEATNLATNQLNAQQFKLLVAKEYQQQTPEVAVAKKETAVSKTATTSQQDQALIKVAKEVSPMVFLSKLKAQSHGYVADNEQRNLEKLMARNALPSSVINLLIYYVIVEKENTTFNQAYPDSIANRWAKDGVNTPEDAIKAIRSYENGERPKQSSRRSRNTKNVKETLPDWAKDDYQTNDTKKQLTTDQRQQLNERLKRLNQKRDGGETHG